MTSHFEESLQEDIDLIRNKVTAMGWLVEDALRAALRAIRERNREIAHSVVLKDRYIDEMENELDWLCLKFLVKQQPAGAHLRLAYSVIKINSHLERVGDYAESIARKFLALDTIVTQPSHQQITEIAELSIRLLHNAMQAFSDQDTDLALKTRAMEKDKTIDRLRDSIQDESVRQHSEGILPSEALVPLMTIAGRWERVGDQAGNICEEVMYMYTGEGVKHSGKEVFRILFVDEHDACRSQMAEGIGNAIGREQFWFESAGLSPELLTPRTIRFMAEKDIDISRQVSSYVDQILDIKKYQAVISLCKESESVLPSPSSKTVSVTWDVQDPSRVKGTEEEIRDAYEQTFQYLDTHIRDFVRTILDHDGEVKEDEG